MRRSASWISFAFLLAAAACGTNNSSGDDADAAVNPDGNGSGNPDAGPPAGYTKLIGRSWSLTAGQTDTYRCVQITLPQDTYIGGFHAEAPTGTHHTVLTITNNPQHADGEWDCSAGSLDFQMLFASGVGTDDLAFPDGVGIKVPAGYHVTLNLHLFDATDHALAGETDIYVKQLSTAPDAAHLAEMVFSGTFTIDVKATAGITQTASGGCALPSDANLIALWPHMHQLGVHQLVTLTPKAGGGTMNLLDHDYKFTEQKNYPWATPIAVKQGDQINTVCSYINTTNPLTEVKFGESSLDEMCFTGIYRYPATGQNLFSCTTGVPAL
jgi:hypothetical protein